jgi:hypothetical protein
MLRPYGIPDMTDGVDVQYEREVVEVGYGYGYFGHCKYLGERAGGMKHGKGIMVYGYEIYEGQWRRE